MSHSCSHHSHSHHHPTPKGFHGAFAIGIVLNAAFIAAELGAGWWANSLALVADAVHNLGDVLGLVAAWFGYALSTRKPSGRYTLGLGRMSIYTTILNGLLLVASSIWIMVESAERFRSPEISLPTVVIVTAVIGIVINLGTAFVLMRGGNDINIRGAMLHMLGDAGVSAAVAVSALGIAATGWLWLDPAMSLIVAVFILWTSLPLLKEGLHLALDGIPSSLNIEQIQSFISEKSGVAGVFDLQVWALSTTKTALSAHIVLGEGAIAAEVLESLHQALKEKYGLQQVTLQLETSHSRCS